MFPFTDEDLQEPVNNIIEKKIEKELKSAIHPDLKIINVPIGKENYLED